MLIAHHCGIAYHKVDRNMLIAHHCGIAYHKVDRNMLIAHHCGIAYHKVDRNMLIAHHCGIAYHKVDRNMLIAHHCVPKVNLKNVELNRHSKPEEVVSFQSGPGIQVFSLEYVDSNQLSIPAEVIRALCG
ncbi:hypothetical protein CHS0354_008100 [Potamilus streckersoni]|uniref:Uncharacterized protein n=1 Tax=Potamilus streckersoni TaxID=2493646 RepID=A0AAE0W5H6_9BIVA|nr:hypothetical protein CHS0354_008100 [Potamilus streckersoni]